MADETKTIDGDVVEVSSPAPLVWRIEQGGEVRNGRVGGWFVLETAHGRVRVELAAQTPVLGDEREEEAALTDLCKRVGIEPDFGVPFEAASATLRAIEVGGHVAVEGRVTRLAFEEPEGLRDAPAAHPAALDAIQVFLGDDAPDKLRAALAKRDRVVAPRKAPVPPPASIASPLRRSNRMTIVTLLGLVAGGGFLVLGIQTHHAVLHRTLPAFAIVVITAAILWRPHWPVPVWYLGIKSNTKPYMHPNDHLQRRGRDRWFGARITYAIFIPFVAMFLAWEATLGPLTAMAFVALLAIAGALAIGLTGQRAAAFASQLLRGPTLGTIETGATMSVTHHVSPSLDDMGRTKGHGITMQSGTLEISDPIRVATPDGTLDVPAREVLWATSNADPKPRQYTRDFVRGYRLVAGDKVIVAGQHETKNGATVLRARGARPVLVLGTDPGGDPLAYARALRLDSWLDATLYVVAAAALVLVQLS